MRELRVSLAQPVIVFVNQMTSCCFDFFLPFEEKRERKVKDRRLWPLRAKVLFFQNLNFVVEILQNKNVSRMKYENPTVSSGIPTRTLGACRIESSSYERTTSKRVASSEFSWFILFMLLLFYNTISTTHEWAPNVKKNFFESSPSAKTGSSSWTCNEPRIMCCFSPALARLPSTRSI